MRELAIITFQTLDGVMQAPSAPDEDPSGGIHERRLGCSLLGGGDGPGDARGDGRALRYSLWNEKPTRRLPDTGLTRAVRIRSRER